MFQFTIDKVNKINYSNNTVNKRILFYNRNKIGKENKIENICIMPLILITPAFNAQKINYLYSYMYYTYIKTYLAHLQLNF